MWPYREKKQMGPVRLVNVAILGEEANGSSEAPPICLWGLSLESSFKLTQLCLTKRS